MEWSRQERIFDLYGKFMRTNGQRFPAYENLMRTKYSGFTEIDGKGRY